MKMQIRRDEWAQFFMMQPLDNVPLDYKVNEREFLTCKHCKLAITSKKNTHKIHSKCRFSPKGHQFNRIGFYTVGLPHASGEKFSRVPMDERTMMSYGEICGTTEFVRNFYPKINPDLLVKLLVIKGKTKKTMTEQINEAIRMYVRKCSHLCKSTDCINFGGRNKILRFKGKGA